jgi:hypothetical protein
LLIPFQLIGEVCGLSTNRFCKDVERRDARSTRWARNCREFSDSSSRWSWQVRLADFDHALTRTEVGHVNAAISCIAVTSGKISGVLGLQPNASAFGTTQAV